MNIHERKTKLGDQDPLHPTGSMIYTDNDHRRPASKNTNPTV